MAERYDERDTMFSRMLELKEGSGNYTDYYKRNPERDNNDRVLRNASGGVFADRLVEQRQIDAVFSLIADLRPLAGHGRAYSDDAELDSDSRLEIEPAEAEINCAPAVEQSQEVVQSYLRIAVIGLALKRIINS